MAFSRGLGRQTKNSYFYWWKAGILLLSYAPARVIPVKTTWVICQASHVHQKPKHMIFTKIRFSLVAVLPALMLSAGNAGAQPQPAGRDSNVLMSTLDNGLRVVIIRDTLAPMVATQITYMAGSYEAPEGYSGTAHALEHMMFRDSKGLTGAQLNEITGKMGAENNAFTTSDATQYFFKAPSMYLDILLHIEATRMRGALLADSDWRLEKGAIEQEVSRDISDPDYLAYSKARKILFGGTGYATDALGSRPSFDSTTSAILRKFYNSWYVPNNALFVIAGDVDPQQTLGKVKELFGNIPAHPTPARVPAHPASFKPRTIRSTTPEGTGSVEFYYRMPAMQSKDYAAAEVLMDVLDNARSSLLALAVQGKVLAAGTWLQSFSLTGLGAIQVSFPKGGDPGKAERAMDSVIRRVWKEGVSPDLVAAAKRSELASFEFNKNSAMTLASEWSQAIAWQGLKSPAEAEGRIRAVTVQDVDRVAREFLKPEQRVTVVLTPNPNGKRPPNSSGFGGTESFAGNDKLNVPLPSWAEQALSNLQMPHWTLNPVRMKLSNGITLIVQPESVSRTVTVRGHIDHNYGLQEPAGQEGVGRLLTTLFDYGTTHLDRDAFHKALDSIAATETGGTNFGIAVPVAGFDRAMQLLADNELHAALPEEGFRVQQQTLSRSLAGELQSPGYRLNRAFSKGLLPSGDPSLRQATPATVDSLILQNVKDFYSRAYRPDLTTIVVVGDITPARARAEVEKYFGSWKTTGPKPRVLSAPVPLNPPTYVVVPNSYASQDQVLMGQMLDLNLDDTDRYALQLGNEVLGGNGFASRLMMDIRVKHGYAYGAGSGMLFDRTRSMFYIEYGCDPDKVEPVDSLIRRDLLEMQGQLIPGGELDNARQAEIRSIPVAVSSVNSIAASLLYWSWHGEPLNQPMIAARHYLDLTPSQVQAAFRKYLKPAHLAQVVEGPAPKSH